jgi:hypothetical protein
LKAFLGDRIFEFGLSNNYAVAQVPILQDRTFQVSLKGYHDLLYGIKRFLYVKKNN